MAKMNQFWKIAFVICMVCCLSLTFVACGDKGDGDAGTTQPTTVGKTNYTVSIRTIGGVTMQNITVYIYTDSTLEELETVKPLQSDGTIAFEATTSSSYVAVLEGVPVGYKVADYYELAGAQTEIVLESGVITDQEKPADEIYNLGDVMYDFTITDCNGNSYTLSQLLEEKDAVVLNFWYLNCVPCKKEFPYLEKAYEEYKDSIELLAINCEDGDDQQLRAFAEENELTFPMAIGDRSYWSPSAYTVCPTTIVVDRYGTIVYKHEGYFDEVAPFNALFRTVTGEEYEQTFIKNVEDIITEDDYRPDGSEERPYELGGRTSFDVKALEKGLVHYKLYRLNNITMRIENPDAYVVIDGVETYPDENGVIEMVVTCPDTFTPLNIAFGNARNGKNTIHVQFVFEPGNVNNPIALVLGENTCRIKEVNGIGVYYTYTAQATGVLTLTVQSCTENAIPEIHLFNDTTMESVYLTMDGTTDETTGLTSVSIHVTEGDHVQIIFSASSDPEAPAYTATINALASLVEDGGTGVIDGRAEHTVTVVDQQGNPVPGAVLEMTSQGETKMLTTDEEGKIVIRLKEDAYFLTMTPPAGYVADVTSFLWTPGVKQLEIQVYTTSTYTVQLQTQYGVALPGLLVRIYEDAAREHLLYAISTDDNGMLTFNGRTDGTYWMTISGAAEDVQLQEAYITQGEVTVIALTRTEDAPSYGLGDVAPEMAVTDVDGVTYNLQQLLQEKKMVILTFWRIDCEESTQMLHLLQKLYVEQGNHVAILALNPVDTLAMDVQMYQSMYDLTLPMALCDANLAQAFGVSTFPTTVIIDCEGKICLNYTGVLTEEQANAITEFFAAENYVHTAFDSLEAFLNRQENGEEEEIPEA